MTRTMTRIDLNTFACACTEQNTIEDLEQALRDGPDATDMGAWSLTPAQWTEQIERALRYLREQR